MDNMRSTLLTAWVLIAIALSSSPLSGQTIGISGANQGQATIGTSTGGLQSSASSFDISAFFNPSTQDICQGINAASVAVGGPATYDARGVNDAHTTIGKGTYCSVADTIATWTGISASAWSGSTVLLGNYTIILGAEQRTNAGCANSPGGVAADCFAAWILPRITLIGTSPSTTIIQADDNGCSGTPKTGSGGPAFGSMGCTNNSGVGGWVVRSAAISGVGLKGSGPQCAVAGNTCWVTLTVGSMSPTTCTGSVACTPQGNELVQVQSTSPTNVSDANWGMFPVCPAVNNPSNNGGCPAAPSTTSISFYNESAVSTTTGGTVFLGTPVVAFGFDQTSSGEQNGLGGTNYSENTSVMNLSIDTRGIAGAIALQNVSSQEGSIVSRVTALNCDFACFDLHNGGASGFGNSGPYTNLYALYSGLTNPPLNYGTLMLYAGSNSTRGFIGAGTFVAQATSGGFYGYGSVAKKPNIGLQIEGVAQNSLFEGIHVEGVLNAIGLGRSQPAVGPHIASFKGHGSVVSCVTIFNNFQYPGSASNGANTSGYLLTEIGANSGNEACSTYTVNDQILNKANSDLNVPIWVYNNLGFGPTFINASSAPGLSSNGLVGSTFQTGLGAGQTTIAPYIFSGTGGAIGLNEGTAPTAVTNVDIVYGDSSSHCIKTLLNNGTALCIPQVISSGTTTLGTSLIGSGACASAVSTSAPNVLTSDAISFSLNAAASGYTSATGSGLQIVAVPTSGNVNFYVCNPSAASITPGSATVNWRIIR